jgi:Leucine-rich repeat (LRR) protein
MPLLRYLPQLIVLDLNDSGVDDGGLVDLVRAAPYLKELDLSHDNVSDSKLTYCKNLRYLNFIDLSNTQITDQGLGNLGHNALLRSLNVNNTKISDKALSSLLARYTEFNALYLRNDDQISDNVIPALTRLRGLGWLDLRNTRVTNRGLLRLAQVTSLKEIAISGSGITADGINRFKQLNAQARVVDDITQVHDFIWIDGSLKYNLFSKN